MAIAPIPSFQHVSDKDTGMMTVAWVTWFQTILGGLNESTRATSVQSMGGSRSLAVTLAAPGYDLAPNYIEVRVDWAKQRGRICRVTADVMATGAGECRVAVVNRSGGVVAQSDLTTSTGFFTTRVVDVSDPGDNSTATYRLMVYGSLAGDYYIMSNPGAEIV